MQILFIGIEFFLVAFMAIGERTGIGNLNHLESLEKRAYDYIPERSYSSPRPFQLELQARFEEKFPGARYVLTYSSRDEKFVIVPASHDLNLIPKESPAVDYGQGVFEGGAVQPIMNTQGELVAASLVNFGSKLDPDGRINRSCKAMGFDVSQDTLSSFKQAVMDLVAILGKDILIREGKPSPAYIRPSVYRKWDAGYGVGLPVGGGVEMTAFDWMWGYLPDRVYSQGASAILFTDGQRLKMTRAKESGNYTEAGSLGARKNRLASANNLNLDNVFLFGPYLVDSSSGRRGSEFNFGLHTQKEVERQLHDIVIGDGTGEEISLIRSNGEVWIPPMNVGRLGGTTLKWCDGNLFPMLGLRTVERSFNLRNVMEEETHGLLILGNAVKVAFVKDIMVADSHNNIIRKIPLKITDIARRVVDTYTDLLSGKIADSSGTLHTVILLDAGAKARKILDQHYQKEGWF